MESQKRKVMLRIAAMIAAFLVLIAGAIWFKSWWIKAPLIILAAAPGAFLVRIAISYKRKKFYFEGKVLSIVPPKGKFGKTSVIMKNGKVSKKLFSLQKLNMKVGNDYGVYFEDKSNEIIQYQPIKPQVMRPTKGQQSKLPIK